MILSKILFRVLPSAMLALALASCITPPRINAPPIALAGLAPVGFPADIRMIDGAGPESTQNAARIISRFTAAADGSVDILALSGGGSGGAFGAGVLVGLTRAKMRPQYEIVTGVSTGALIAPFAFLGPEWDALLTEAYTEQPTGGFLLSRGLGALFWPGLYRNEPLIAMIDRFVTPQLLAAIAREDARGRLLLVGTTNLDSGDAVIWDMGAIARRGEPALRLFRDVLLASASVPAVFPPVMISVESGGTRFQEMHVDGGVATPFFLLPDMESLLRAPQAQLRGAHAFVIVNGQLEPPATQTPRNSIPILARSLEINQIVQTRDSLAVAVNFAERNGMQFQFTRVPADLVTEGPLDFNRATMEALFAQGLTLGETGRVWQTADQFLRAQTQ